MRDDACFIDVAKIKAGLAIVEMLKLAGFDAVVAGGSARDVAHGKFVKDVDIIVLPNSADQASYSKLCDILRTSGCTQKEGISDYEFNGDVVIRIMGVFEQTTLLGEYDVVVYNPNEFESAMDCVKRGFDVNMNQFVVDKVVGESVFVTYHGTTHYDQAKVELIRNDISDTRRARLIEVAKELGWNYDCLVETTML